MQLNQWIQWKNGNVEMGNGIPGSECKKLAEFWDSEQITFIRCTPVEDADNRVLQHC